MKRFILGLFIPLPFLIAGQIISGLDFVDSKHLFFGLFLVYFAGEIQAIFYLNNEK